MNMTYLTVTTIVSDQKIRDMTPRMLSGVMVMAWGPWKHSLTVYSGLVPMSPYTTPRAPRARSSFLLDIWIDCLGRRGRTSRQLVLTAG